MWPAGFWDRLLAGRGGVGVVDMFIGEAKWDGLMMHLGQPNMTDVSAFHLLLHVSGLHNPAAKGWRAVSQADMDRHRGAVNATLPDNVHNAKTVCRLTFQDSNWGRCRMRSTVYEAEFQMCPSGAIRKIEYRQRKMYRAAVTALNAGFPRALAKEVDALEARLNATAAIFPPEERAQLERTWADKKAQLDSAFPREKRLTERLRSGDCASLRWGEGQGD